MFEEGAERNKALAVWGAVGASGATVGVLAGGLLTRYAGWEYIFFINVPIGAVALALTRRLVPESRLDAVRKQYDVLGAATATGGLLLFVYAISEAPDVGWATARTIALLAAAAALPVGFIAVEATTAAPLVPLRIFRLRTLAGSNVVSFLLGGSFFAFIFVGTLYMQQVLHYSALQTGVAWLAASVTSVALSGVSQALITRGSLRVVMAAGMAMIAGGLIWAAQAPAGGRFWADLAGPFFVVGAGTAFSFIPVTIGGLAGVAEREAGLASGLINTTQQLGGALGVAIASTVATSHFGHLLRAGTPEHQALAGGFQWAFWVCGAIALAAIPIALQLVRGAVASVPADVVTSDASPGEAVTEAA
jgi:MFS family permease